MKFQSVNKFLIAILIFVSACNFSNGLTKQKAAEIYVHLQIYQEQNRNSPDLLKSKMNKLFAEYETSSEDYKNYFETFGEDEKEWNDFFILAEKYLAELKNKKH